MTIQLKRAYEQPKAADGKRILVERLWPRGVSKDEARIDYWDKTIAPSSALRKWYGHEVKRWPSFRKKYIQELQQNEDAVAELRKQCRGKKVTFVYAAKDEEHNSAVVLKDFLENRL